MIGEQRWEQSHTCLKKARVQRLRLRASTAGGAGSIPGQGTKIPHATWCSQKQIKFKKKKKAGRNRLRPGPGASGNGARRKAGVVASGLEGSLCLRVGSSNRVCEPEGWDGKEPAESFENVL